MMLRSANGKVRGGAVLAILLSICVWSATVAVCGDCSKYLQLNNGQSSVSSDVKQTTLCNNTSPSSKAHKSLINYHCSKGICCSGINTTATSVKTTSGDQIVVLRPIIAIAQNLFNETPARSFLCESWITAWSSTSPPHRQA